MPATNARKKSQRKKHVTIRFDREQLLTFRKAAALDKRSLNNFVVAACGKRAAAVLQRPLFNSQR
mgnify:CR=1 FL=1